MEVDQDIQVEAICPGGDLILLVGNQSNPKSKSKLLVSSTVMCNTSPVFRRMLRPYFREGRALRSPSTPQEISLPEDSSQGMATMCGLLHYNIAYLDGCNWTSERLAELASTLDKYACCEVLRLPAQALISQYLERNGKEASIKELIQITAASYVVDDRRSFIFATRRLAMMVDGYFLNHIEPKVDNVHLPSKVLRK